MKDYLTVSALNKYIEYRFNNDNNLKNILLKAELSNVKYNKSGHIYFTLGDEFSTISAVMFRDRAFDLTSVLKDGDKVYVSGTVTCYVPYGKYQIIVDEVEKAGIGDLAIKLAKMKEQMLNLGYFNEEHKKPLPKFPKVIGVITSETGAVIKDIITTVKRRYPKVNILLYPTIVQGEEAAINISANIKKANLDNLCDVLIVGRGGGSFEDLFCFNEFSVCRAIYESTIPVISAIGHETDTTLADFVADKRAATPTAAAELATPSIKNLEDELNFILKDLARIFNHKIDTYKMSLRHLEEKLKTLDPLYKINEKKYDLSKLNDRLNLGIKQKLYFKRQDYENILRILESLNPTKLLARGYSITLKDNKVINNLDDIKVGDKIESRFSFGTIISNVFEVENGK